MARDTFDDYDDASTAVATAGVDVDPSYAEQFANGTGEEVAERRMPFEPIPNGLYVVKAVSAAGLLTSEGNPRVRAQVEILEGINDTVGRKVTDSGGIYFVTKRTSKIKGKEVFLEGEARDKTSPFGKKVANRHAMLNRIKNVLSFQIAAPSMPTEDAIQDYANQFTETTPPFIMEIRIEKGSDGVNRNKFVWESIEALDGPVKDKNGNVVGGRTALDEVRTKIAAQEKGATQARGRGGRNAGTMGRPSTPTAY